MLRPREAGFALIEVLVSAVIVVLVSGAVFGLLEASAHSAAEQRRRSEAYAIAQEDQARLRSLPVPQLNRLSQTRTVTVNGTPFKVESSGLFVNDKTGTSSCGQGTSSADYVKVTSTVSWPSLGTRKPAEIQSIVTPPPGSLNPSHGTLTIFAANAHEVPIPGVGLSGTGAGTFNGSTDENGCAMFPDEPSGNYTLTPSGIASGLVNTDGNPPGPETVSVVAGSTSTVQLLYDIPGAIKAKFTTLSGGSVVAAKASSMIVFNTGMTTAKAFASKGGNPEGEISTGKTLFPFVSPDTVYAGACTTNNPNPNGEAKPPDPSALANVAVTANGEATPTIQLPALELTVKNKETGKAVSGTKATATDLNCSPGGVPVKRTYTTNSSGQLPEPGLPWSSYEICADAPITTIKKEGKKETTETVTRKETTSVELHSTKTTLELPISSSSAKGEC